MQLSTGTLLQGGKYLVTRVLGQGGFGITYEAEQVNLGRKVAIKEFFMKDCCERNMETSHVTVGTGAQRDLVEKFRGKFVREAKMIASLEHPHIVRVIDVFEENNTAYYVMENLPGGSLSDKVKKEGRLSEDQAEKYIRQVADALAYIHSRDTVHLDVKPSNILLNSKGDAVLIDFGISKHYDEAGEQTSSTPVGISKGFAPLEQSRDGDVSQFKPSTDIYALGASLYYLVTGAVPPEATVVNEEGLKRPMGISNRIWQVIEKSMQPKRKDRPQSIANFLRLLDIPSAPSNQDDESTVVHQTQKPIRKADPKPKQHNSKTKTKSKSDAISKGKSQIKTTGHNHKIGILSSSIGIILTGVFLLFALRGRGQMVGPASGIENGHEWVDLGLSVNWAMCNIGASSPAEYGNYYAWGETKSKSIYSKDNYKYKTNGVYEDYVTTSYSKYYLDFTDDAARVNWGSRWRMPTVAELEELRNKCTWTWTKHNGKKGYLIKSKKNGNSIFLPATGYKDNDVLSSLKSLGYYLSSNKKSELSWSGTPLSNASNLAFGRDSYEISSISCFYGLVIRPVLDSPIILNADGSAYGKEYVDMGLSVKWATCNLGSSTLSDCGDLFAWGETKSKNSFEWKNYLFCSSYNAPSSINPQGLITLSKYKHLTEDTNILELSDDAARMKWKGAWRIPTAHEINELYEKCSWKWTDIQGVRGFLVTSRVNGKSIFLPVNDDNSGGYWTSSLNTPPTAHCLFLGNPQAPSTEHRLSYTNRCQGLFIRPVLDE